MGEADRVWAGSMPDAYERFLVPSVFQPFAIDLARRVVAHRPRRVLELAAGSGVLTRELTATSDSPPVTATDLNTAMVELGRDRAPRAEWRQADAMSLPFDDGAFDVIVCQFGVMFFPDKPAAFAEARRVLAPEGTLLFNTWARIDEHEYQAALVAALARTFPDDPPTFMGSVPHGYADTDLIEADLRASGLRSVTVESITLEGRATSAADVALGYCLGTPVRAEIEARGDLDATIATVTKEMEVSLGTSDVTGRMTAHVIEARR